MMLTPASRVAILGFGTQGAAVAALLAPRGCTLRAWDPLLAGPATNVASLVVVRNDFGNRIFAGYVAALAGVSVAFGAVLDWMLGNVNVPAATPTHIHAGTPWLATACTLAFLLWTAVSAHRSRLLPRTWVTLTRMAGRPSPR